MEAVATTNRDIEHSNNRPPYYAKDGMVWKHPVYSRGEKGGMNISIGFPVARMHEACGAEQAEAVAQLMNRGAAVDDLLAALEEILDYTGGADTALNDDYVVDRARAAIAKAKGTAQ